MVDVTNQITRAYTYDENGQYTVLVREMICSTGTSKYPTPCGTTIMPKKRARWGLFPDVGLARAVSDAHRFRQRVFTPCSTPSRMKRPSPLNPLKRSARLRRTACVRLLVSDAKWIYDNCKEGTIITVYEGEYDPEYTMTLKPTLNTSTLRENPLAFSDGRARLQPCNWPTKYRTPLQRQDGRRCVHAANAADRAGLLPRLSHRAAITAARFRPSKDFQKDHGLTVDGAAGKQTQALLLLRCRRPGPPRSRKKTSVPVADTPVPTAAPTLTPEPTPTPQPTFTPTPDPALYNADSGFGRVNDNFCIKKRARTARPQIVDKKLFSPTSGGE